jgi:hypothetical protein
VATDYVDRLLGKILIGDSCWPWIGIGDSGGYGRINVTRTRKPVHRVVYELFVGSIPDGHHLHHTCGNTRCVRPSHLLAVTPREHSVEYTPNSLTYKYARVTSCPHGHPYDAENTSFKRDGGRNCRACARVRACRYRARYPEQKRESDRRYRERLRLAREEAMA